MVVKQDLKFVIGSVEQIRVILLLKIQIVVSEFIVGSVEEDNHLAIDNYEISLDLNSVN